MDPKRLADGLLESPAALRVLFEEAVPFRHLTFEQFFEPALLERLIADFPAFEQGSSRNEMGAAGGKSHRTDVAAISPAYAEIDALMRSSELLGLLSAATGIPDLLYDPDYVGGGTHENLSGQDLDPHIDFNFHPTRGWHRRLNLIVFLNREWEESWGGVLELHSDPRVPERDRVARVLPRANRAVLFETTEGSWHGFRAVRAPAGVSRRSLAVYFYTHERPREETAPSHSTVYRQRGLPERLTPGHTLTADDLAEVQALLARRDAQIEFLYDREKRMQSDFDAARLAVESSLSFRLGRVLTGPLRALRGLLEPRR